MTIKNKIQEIPPDICTHKKPLTCSDNDDYPRLPITVCGGKQFILPLPFPIFDLLHEQFICFFGTDEKLFTQTDFTG